MIGAGLVDDRPENLGSSELSEESEWQRQRVPPAAVLSDEEDDHEIPF